MPTPNSKLPVSEAYTGHILCGCCGSSSSPLISLLDEMRTEGRRGGERKEGRSGKSMLWGEGTHLLGQVQLPAAVSLGPPKCVHCHLLSMRLTACQNKKPDRKSQKEYLEGRVLAAEIAGALNWLQSAVDKTIAIVTLAQVTSNIISIFF